MPQFLTSRNFSPRGNLKIPVRKLFSFWNLLCHHLYLFYFIHSFDNLFIPFLAVSFIISIYLFRGRYQIRIYLLMWYTKSEENKSVLYIGIAASCGSSGETSTVFLLKREIKKIDGIQKMVAKHNFNGIYKISEKWDLYLN